MRGKSYKLIKATHNNINMRKKIKILSRMRGFYIYREWEI